VAKFPEPLDVATLATVPADLTTLPAGTELWRLYARGGRHPVLWDTFRSFGPTLSRFDHHFEPPSVQSRAVLYCASAGPTCLAEAFQDTRTIDRTARDPWLVAFETVAPLQLLDLCGSWPTRAGASQAIASGQRARAQRWARVIYEAYPDLVGVIYPSSMSGGQACIAIWERGEDTLPPSPVFHRPLLDPALLTPLRNAAADLGYGLV